MTRAVGLEALRDLIEAPPRAYLAYVSDGAPEADRLSFRREGERWLVTLPPEAQVRDGAHVVLLIDDGDVYSELRGVRVRGILRDDGAGSHEVVADKVVCWDYGSMRRRAS